MDKVYVLTERVNYYNQYGKYFLGVFKDIPTLEEVNACSPYRGKIYDYQYEQLIKYGIFRYHSYYDFLYLREVKL